MSISLTKEQLKHIQEYKYATDDYTYLDHKY